MSEWSEEEYKREAKRLGWSVEFLKAPKVALPFKLKTKFKMIDVSALRFFKKFI